MLGQGWREELLYFFISSLQQVGKNEGHHEGTISVTNLQRREVRPFNKMVDGEDAYVLVC